MENNVLATPSLSVAHDFPSPHAPEAAFLSE